MNCFRHKLHCYYYTFSNWRRKVPFKANSSSRRNAEISSPSEVELNIEERRLLQQRLFRGGYLIVGVTFRPLEIQSQMFCNFKYHPRWGPPMDRLLFSPSYPPFRGTYVNSTVFWCLGRPITDARRPFVLIRSFIIQAHYNAEKIQMGWSAWPGWSVGWLRRRNRKPGWAGQTDELEKFTDLLLTKGWTNCC